MDVVEEKQTERFARLRARLQRLREHHDKCLSRHMEREKQQKQPSGGPNHDSESSSLPDRPFEQFPDSSLEIIQDSDSDTEIFPPESSHSGPAEDSDDPPLRITDSLLITKEYLELYSSDILQCVEQMTDSESKEFLKNLERRSRCEKKWDVSLLLRAIKDTLKEVPWNAMSLDQIDPDEEVLEVHSDLSQTETDSFCSSSSGPPRSKRGQRTSAGPGSAAATGSSRSTKRQRPESDSGDPETENTKRRSWSFAEVHTVEKTLMAFINSGKVPGKCFIKAPPKALEQRSWTASSMLKIMSLPFTVKWSENCLISFDKCVVSLTFLLKRCWWPSYNLVKYQG